MLATAYYRAGEDVDPATVEPYPPGLMMVAGRRTRHRGPADQHRGLVVRGGRSAGVGADDVPGPGRPAAARDVPRLLGRRTRRQRRTTAPTSSYSPDGECDDAHPVPIPQLQFTIDYPPVPGDPADLALASGETFTAHADFWNAWHEAKLAEEVELCIHRQLVCGVSG